MPRNSIDHRRRLRAAVAEIPGAIAEYDERRRAGRIAEGTGAQLDAVGAALHEVLTLLRSRTGHDFSNYKPATVLRRIERRMAVRKRATIADYAAFMRETPDETAAADEGPADQRHQLLPRSGGLRGARDARHPAAVRAQAGRRPGARLGGRLRHRRRGLLDRHAARRARRDAVRAPRHPGVRHRPRRQPAIATAREGLYTEARCRRRLGRAAAPLLPAGRRRLSRPPRAARDDAVRASQRDQRSAVLASRPDRLPQPADLSEPHGAGAGDGNVPFRAAAGRLPVSRRLRDVEGGRRSVRAVRQGRAPLREPRSSASRPAPSGLATR